jgi:hypothetical protein
MSATATADSERVKRINEMLEAFTGAPKEQPLSDLHIVIVYKATLERVKQYMRSGEHVFQFTDKKEGHPTACEWDYQTRNAHAVRDWFLKVKTQTEALDFLSNTGIFSPLSHEITWSEFQLWQRFAYLVQQHSELAATTMNERPQTGECMEVLKALTGEAFLFPSSFFDEVDGKMSPAEDEAFWRDLRSPVQTDQQYREMCEDIRESDRKHVLKRYELYSWFHKPLASIEEIPANKEAEKKATRYYEGKGFGPWMIEFILSRHELQSAILIRPTYTLQAIAAAIYADHKHGVEWRACGNANCICGPSRSPKLVKLGAYGNKYCSKKCKTATLKRRARKAAREREEKLAAVKAQEEALAASKLRKNGVKRTHRGAQGVTAARISP